MPEEQPTNLEPESGVQGSVSNDDAPPKSKPAVDTNLTSTSKSDSPKPPSSQPESPDTQVDHQNPTGAPQESIPTKAASERKPLKTPSKKEFQSSADDAGGSKKVTKKSASPAPEAPTSEPKSIKTPSRKESQNSVDGPGGSKIEAAFFQVLGLANKIVSPIFSTLRKVLVESKLYSSLQDRLKPLQPVFKVFSLIWKQIIIPVGNNIIKPLWGLVLKFLRGRFPDALKAFSDRFLTIVGAGLFALIYWLFSSLMPASSPQPAVQKPPAPVVTAPRPGPTTPPALQPAPVAEAPVIEEPPPPPEPEQKQIIDVQTQVAEVFDRYSQDLIQSVQANFQAERLVIKVSDRWFDLPRTEQNQLGTDVLERSRKLEFPKLEIRDQTDQLLAREPVVGSNIIVLQRRSTPAATAVDSPA